MTRREEMISALRRQPVDRVPYATYNLHPYGRATPDGEGAGGPASNPFLKDQSYAGLLEKVRVRAAAFIKTGASGMGPGLTRWQPDRLRTKVMGDGDARTRTSILRTPRGELTCVRREPENKPSVVVKPYVTCDEDIEKYMSVPYEPPDFDVGLARTVCDQAGDRGIVAVCFLEAMYSVASLFDFEEFCIRCATDLPGILRFIGWAQERCLENMRLLCEACRGLDVVLHVVGPEVCTPPMMAPELFGKLVTPFLSELITVAHENGFLVGIHCHGRVREVFPEVLKAGADLLEPIEPPEQGNISLVELMDRAAGRICLMGYVQDQEFYTAPPGFMTRRVEEIARVVAGRTGYIMSPTCTPFQHPCSEVYRRNYSEWLDAAERVLRGPG